MLMTTAGQPDTPVKKRARRTQEQRTADTRAALFAAAVTTIDRLGYAGANNASIADEAGVSRGAITHHFNTRAAFMAEVVRWVFDQETLIFRDLMRAGHVGSRIADWPALLWDVFSRPSGVAVMEILVASRSDPELAALVMPMQAEVERAGAVNFLQRIGGTTLDMSAIRLVVWAIRGMTMGRAFIGDREGMDDAVALFTRLIDRAVPSGSYEEFAGI